MRFKLDRASLIVGSKFTIFSLFYVVFEGNFPRQYKPLGGLYLEGRFNAMFFMLLAWGTLEGLIHGGAYFWNFIVFLIIMILYLIIKY